MLSGTDAATEFALASSPVCTVPPSPVCTTGGTDATAAGCDK